MMPTMSSEVVVTYLNIVLYALSYQLQRPVEPFLVRSLIHDQSNPSGGGDNNEEESTANRTYGRLTSFFSLIQTVGSPLVGTLLDRIGPRRTSVLCYGASAASYWILARATTPAWLYCSKVPTLLQHAFLVGQATVASLPDVEGEDGTAGTKRRAAALGRMTTAYTVGATVGPALGGYLASTADLYAGARLAVWGSLLSVALSLAYLRDHPEKRKEDDDGVVARGDDSSTSTPKKSASFARSVRNTLAFLRHPTIGPLLFVKLLNGVSSSAFSTVLPLVLANRLRFSTEHMGYFMSASSLSVAAFAAVGISPAMAAAGNRPDRLAFAGIASRVASVVAFGAIVSWAMSSSMMSPESEGDAIAMSAQRLATTTLASVAVSLSSHMHATSLTTLTTGTVSADERGAILGLEHGLFSMARVVGPPLGTTLLSRGSVAFGFVGGSGEAVGGLWNVILACVVMDFMLMALLNVWSTRQSKKKEMIGSQVGGSGETCSPLMDDHDHSD